MIPKTFEQIVELRKLAQTLNSTLHTPRGMTKAMLVGFVGMNNDHGVSTKQVQEYIRQHPVYVRKQLNDLELDGILTSYHPDISDIRRVTNTLIWHLNVS